MDTSIINENDVDICGCGKKHTLPATHLFGDKIDDDKIFDLADFFKLFGDSTRLRILLTLSDEELCVGDIAEALDITQSAISHQLKVLKQSKLVKNRRDGKSMLYSLADDHVTTIVKMGIEHICE